MPLLCDVLSCGVCIGVLTLGLIYFCQPLFHDLLWVGVTFSILNACSIVAMQHSQVGCKMTKTRNGSLCL